MRRTVATATSLMPALARRPAILVTAVTVCDGTRCASSGARLMMQLARQFAEHPEVRYGLTTMCIGMGMGATVLWENTGLRENTHRETEGGTK
jgi:Thiolase, C-terminal domain